VAWGTHRAHHWAPAVCGRTAGPVGTGRQADPHSRVAGIGVGTFGEVLLELAPGVIPPADLPPVTLAVAARGHLAVLAADRLARLGPRLMPAVIDGHRASPGPAPSGEPLTTALATSTVAVLPDEGLVVTVPQRGTYVRGDAG